MEIKNYDEVKNRFNKLIDLDTYFDYILLSNEDFMEKHKYLGWSFSNFFEIRFDKDIDVINAIQDFIVWKKDCLLILLNPEKKVFKIKSDNIYSFITNNKLNSDDFIILHEGTKWVLVKNKYNNIIGIGSYIIKRMKKNCFMTFGGNKITYSFSDTK